MFYVRTAVEEAFSFQSLLATPPLQNLILLYKISSNFNKFSEPKTPRILDLKRSRLVCKN